MSILYNEHNTFLHFLNAYLKLMVYYFQMLDNVQFYFLRCGYLSAV